ncbi:tRNA 2-thiouridine(34) synthase MnmA, partial [Candidatus Uhrbacteria bacterium]|nr:tRNA 2-thiouridine(34) synthase MnmA [Candidatus Uhrbacteria bacterium]
KNTVTVAEGKEDATLYRKEAQLENIHWIAGTAPQIPLDCMARIRYRQPLQECLISMGTTRDMVPMLSVLFTNPQRAVTPGQACVFYDGEHMLGGGVII